LFDWNGAWFSDPHDNSVLNIAGYYREQSFESSRVLVLGDTESVASSAHDGDTWSAFLGGGMEIPRGEWSPPAAATHCVARPAAGYPGSSGSAPRCWNGADRWP
jgi:hypothetical protein